MKNVLSITTVLSLLLLVLTAPAGASDGVAIVKEKKCTDCHSIQAQGVEKKVSAKGQKKKGPDLSGVGNKMTADDISQFLLKKTSHKSVYSDKSIKHKKKWKGSDADLKAVAEYLAQQKSNVKVVDEGVDEDSGGDEE